MEVVVAEDCSTTELAAENPEEVESEVKLGRVELPERDVDPFWSFLVNPACGP